MRALLGRVGIEVIVVTTQDAGAALLASLGDDEHGAAGRVRMNWRGATSC